MLRKEVVVILLDKINNITIISNEGISTTQQGLGPK